MSCKNCKCLEGQSKCKKVDDTKDRITTLEQSIRLKQLGANQEINVKDFFYCNTNLCIFLYDNVDLFDIKNNGNYFDFEDGIFFELESYKKLRFKTVKAFDGAQVDEMLPTSLEEKEIAISYYFSITKEVDESFLCSYWYHESERHFDDVFAYGKTKLEAKTNLLIKLLENGIIIL